VSSCGRKIVILLLQLQGPNSTFWGQPAGHTKEIGGWGLCAQAANVCLSPTPSHLSVHSSPQPHAPEPPTAWPGHWLLQLDMSRAGGARLAPPILALVVAT
jgi:hypothetical protein